LDLPQLTDKQWTALVRYRFSVIVMNPIRTWSIDGKEYKFNRGSNHPKGLHMSNLGALVRNVFYDKKTVVIYALDGSLNRKGPIIEEPEFFDVLKDEWACHRLYAPLMPHSLEYMARCYQALIQKVIEPDLDVDTLKEMMKNLFGLTFGKLLTGKSVGPVNSLDEKKKIDERRRKEYVEFGQNLASLALEFDGHKPYRAVISKDLTDYSIEQSYKDPMRRTDEIRKALGIS
jgi:hypothetical protein